MTSAEFQTLRKKANIAQHGLGYTCWEGQLERFATLVRNAALEEAAQKCEAWAKHHGVADQCTYQNCDFVAAATDCADAIRNLKEPTP